MWYPEKYWDDEKLILKLLAPRKERGRWPLNFNIWWEVLSTTINFLYSTESALRDRDSANIVKLRISNYFRTSYH